MENLFRGRGCNSHPVLGFFRYPQDCVLKQVLQAGAALLFFLSKIKVYLCTSEQSKLEKHSYGSKKFWKKQVYKSNYKIPLFCHSEKIGCLCKSGRKGHNLQRAISKPLPWRGGGQELKRLITLTPWPSFRLKSRGCWTWARRWQTPTRSRRTGSSRSNVASSSWPGLDEPSTVSTKRGEVLRSKMFPVGRKNITSGLGSKTFVRKSYGPRR